jgi:hypothetical protein
MTASVGFEHLKLSQSMLLIDQVGDSRHSSNEFMDDTADPDVEESKPDVLNGILR